METLLYPLTDAGMVRKWKWNRKKKRRSGDIRRKNNIKVQINLFLCWSDIF